MCANGRVERFNGTLKGILKKYIDKEQLEWDKHVSKAVYIYNNTRHESTNYSPYELLHGRASRNPFRISQSEEYKFEDFDPDRILAREQALENMNRSAIVTKHYYDKKHRAAEFVEGQEILIRWIALPLKISRKLAHKWIGPFKLVKLIGDKENPNSIIYKTGEGKLERAAFNNVKPYNRRDDEESRRLEEIIKQYEEQGIPALISDLAHLKEGGDVNDELINEDVQPVSESEPPDIDDSVRNSQEDIDLNNLYPERPIPTQELIQGRAIRCFGPMKLVRKPCRPAILRRPSVRQPVVVPAVSPLEILNICSQPSAAPATQGSVPADYDPLSMLEGLEDLAEPDHLSDEITTGSSQPVSSSLPITQASEEALQPQIEPPAHSEQDELAIALDNLVVESQKVDETRPKCFEEAKTLRRSTRIPSMSRK